MTEEYAGPELWPVLLVAAAIVIAAASALAFFMRDRGKARTPWVSGYCVKRCRHYSTDHRHAICETPGGRELPRA